MSFYSQYTHDIICGVLKNNKPAQNLVPITPSDSTLYNPTLRGFTVGVSGNVAVLTYDDWINGLTASKIIPCVGGVDKPIYVVKIFATGTSASNIVGYLD